ncbi:uncharacterized protein B0T15DRAFT_543608 [Chaetomium strumarium]|uniref:F-box domain-containing protein n=1 Tax=Chaetomium strumarium TaxID=1170767 RepID=A0AAJ0GMX3_9PEZI|nr:hypothetical protein B0T15DRAFT_543608 [Chaetomium strumarium]
MVAGSDGGDDAVMTGTGGRALVLEAMPPEIITTILEFLVPQPPEIGETRPVAYSQLMADEPWFDFTRCRRGLHSVCRVSRLLSEMARPLLYRVIAILDETALVLLLRTLYNKPEYGLWTRYVSCHFTLSREKVIRDTRQLLVNYLSTFIPAPVEGITTAVTRDFLQLLRGYLPHMLVSEGDLDHVPQALLCFILMHLTKLEVWLLQVPISDDHEEYDVLCSQINEIAPLFESDPTAGPFQHVHTLLLQGDPELLDHFESADEECDCEVPEVYGAQPRRYAPLFASLPKLTTLEVSGDDGVWAPVDDELRAILQSMGPLPPFLPNLRHIYLHDSFAFPGDLHYLLQNAPRLETLYMTPRRDGADIRLPMLEDHTYTEALDVALAQHAKHLRNLDVSWEDLTNFESLVGPDGRLSALANMTELRSLCIQMALLYGSPAAVLETPLVELLPPNIVELALEDWWWHSAELLDELPHWDAQDKVKHYQSQHLYRQSALRTLTQFARDVRTRLHNLKKVVLLCKIPWTWVLEGGVPIEFHFENVKSLFLAQGVEFSVKSDEF